MALIEKFMANLGAVILKPKLSNVVANIKPSEEQKIKSKNRKKRKAEREIEAQYLFFSLSKL